MRFKSQVLQTARHSTFISMLRFVVIFGGLLLGSQLAHATCTSVSGGSGTGATDGSTVLMLASTLAEAGNPGGNLCNSLEAVRANALSLNVEIDDAAAWGAKTTAQFASYRAIVLGDADCPDETQTGVSGDSPVTAAKNNAGTWGPAISGPIVVVGTDPEFHYLNNSDAQKAGALQLTENAIAYAVSGGSGKTGAYVCLSCYY